MCMVAQSSSGASMRAPPVEALVDTLPHRRIRRRAFAFGIAAACNLRIAGATFNSGPLQWGWPHPRAALIRAILCISAGGTTLLAVFFALYNAGMRTVFSINWLLLVRAAVIILLVACRFPKKTKNRQSAPPSI